MLSLAVLVTHLGYGKLSAAFGVDPRIVFYAATGTLSALLCLALGISLSDHKNSIWKLAVYLALGFGAAQGLMMNCIVLGPPPLGQDVCDYHAGFPVGLYANVLALFIACFLFGRSLKRESQRLR